MSKNNRRTEVMEILLCGRCDATRGLPFRGGSKGPCLGEVTMIYIFIKKKKKKKKKKKIGNTRNKREWFYSSII
jgi:hypothetical protein